jgi:hypothetical protein
MLVMKKMESKIQYYLLSMNPLDTCKSDLTIASIRESIVNSVYGRSPDL